MLAFYRPLSLEYTYTYPNEVSHRAVVSFSVSSCQFPSPSCLWFSRSPELHFRTHGSTLCALLLNVVCPVTQVVKFPENDYCANSVSCGGMWSWYWNGNHSVNPSCAGLVCGRCPAWCSVLSLATGVLMPCVVPVQADGWMDSSSGPPPSSDGYTEYVHDVEHPAPIS
eukprot:3038526-Rhodomonas_salina.1